MRALKVILPYIVHEGMKSHITTVHEGIILHVKMFFSSCFHVLIDRSHRINTLLTVYWKYHSSVVVLPLVPTVLVAIQQQTRDISQYTVNNIYICGNALFVG